MAKIKGFRDIAEAQIDKVSAPTDEEFNPYDYIDSNNYKNNDRGRMQYQEDLARLLYMAQINQENRMNEYNSPTEQAKRMREAGINPDLNGVENLGATNVAGYQGNPMDGTQSNLQNVSDVFGIISSVSSMATSLMTGIPGISLSNVQKLGAKIQNGAALFSLFDNSDGSEFLADVLPSLSRSERNQIKRAEGSYLSSTRGEGRFLRNQRQSLEDRGAVNSMSVDPRYSEDAIEYYEAWQPYIDAMSEYAVEDLKGKSARSRYDQSFYGSDSGSQDRSHEKSQQDMFRQFKQPLIEVMKNFDKIDDPATRNIYKAALASFILKILPL